MLKFTPARSTPLPVVAVLISTLLYVHNHIYLEEDQLQAGQKYV